MSESIVIVGAKRTPIGGMNGQFVNLTSPQLAAVAIKAAVEQSCLKAEDVSEALIGCVLPAGLGQAPARWHGGCTRFNWQIAAEPKCAGGLSGG